MTYANLQTWKNKLENEELKKKKKKKKKKKTKANR